MCKAPHETYKHTHLSCPSLPSSLRKKMKLLFFQRCVFLVYFFSSGEINPLMNTYRGGGGIRYRRGPCAPTFTYFFCLLSRSQVLVSDLCFTRVFSHVAVKRLQKCSWFLSSYFNTIQILIELQWLQHLKLSHQNVYCRDKGRTLAK